VASLQHIDYILFDFINHTLSNPFFDILFPVVRHANTWIPLYLFLFLFLLKKYQKLAIVYVVYIFISFAMADSISASILKPFFERLRPCHAYTQVRLLLDSCGGKWSFPSSHASNHMSIAMSIYFASIFSKKWTIGFWFLWALIIGIAQVYVGVHYPSDIIGGFILGTLIAYLNSKFILKYLSTFVHFLLK
jgi:membrane-associated phospholipid phosphatase